MNILVLAPHTDDEIACAGTLSKYGKDSNIDIVAFSYPKEIKSITNEFIKSCHVLKAMPTYFDFPIRNLYSVRQKVLDVMVGLKRKYDLVFCPCSTDTHQDHEVIRNECFRAFKNTTIYGYQAPHNCVTFHSHIFVVLSKKNVEDKMRMVRCYASQSDRPYFTDGYNEVLAKANGISIKQQYAEVFENIRTVIK
jgi:LmbE family N-acetylglucosaminyl deacetylase